jgi:hypothetical protein
MENNNDGTILEGIFGTLPYVCSPDGLSDLIHSRSRLQTRIGLLCRRSLKTAENICPIANFRTTTSTSAQTAQQK